MGIADALVRDLRTEAENTRKVLAAVPADRFDWKPHEKSMSLAQLAGHIAENPGWVAGFVEDDFDIAALMADYQPFVPQSREELLAKLDESLAEFESAFGGRDDAFMTREWTMRMGDQVMLRAPRQTAARETMIHHWIHHRGQLTVYLRLLDVPVPQTYGPTADYPDMPPST